MINLNWYKNRLASMSVSELPYRVLQYVSKTIDKSDCNKKEFVVRYNTRCLLNIDKTAIKDYTFKRNIQVFAEVFDYATNSINWHNDIFSNLSFPISYSKSISIRANKNLSAKNVWEINRLQFLPQLAINYVNTGDENLLQQFVSINQSWINDNPYLMGVNWYSNIEVNIRLINWFMAWEILKADEIEIPWFKEFLNADWIPTIYQHCKHSKANPSYYSSANNHLISEYAGLFIAASKWEFKESKEWLQYAKKGLEKEIIKQHSKGINKEEAAEYIQFITDFFLITYVVGENTNNCFSSTYKRCLHEIFEYIYEFTDCDTNFPKYGDEDDGRVVILSTDAHSNNFKSLLSSAAIIFNESKYIAKSSGFDLKNKILFGNKVQSIFTNNNNHLVFQESKFYKDEGHFIFRKQTENKEIYLHFDAAPLGYLSIAAHGHADALSFILHINGNPIFIDSGTYSYHVAKEWRSYFVSTLAHNTICVDNKNQANHAGDTMWLNHYKCSVIEVTKNENVEKIVASHNGYKPIIHTRSIEFNKLDNCFYIIDTLISNDNLEHEAILLFHLHPDIDCEIVESFCMLKHKSGISVELELQDSVNVIIAEGETNPIFGWYSDSFMQKCPCKVIYQKIKFKNKIQLKSKIKIYEY